MIASLASPCLRSRTTKSIFLPVIGQITSFSQLTKERKIHYACHTYLPRRLHRRNPKRRPHHHGRCHVHRGFLGRAPRGPANEPTTINSFGDFERQFGGLDVDYPMSYAVRDFYLNGGSQAIIVRLFVPPSSTDDGAARLTDDGLKLVAGSPGAWGQGLRLAIDPEVSDEVRTNLGLGANDALFNLTVQDTNPGGTTERFLNLTVVDSARRIDRVLTNESNLVRWDGPWSTPLPALTNLQTARGDLKTLQDALKASPPDQTAINNARTTYNTAKADLADPVTQAEKTLADATNAQPPGDVAGAQTALAAEIAKVKGANGSALNDTAYEGDPATKSGIYALDKADLFNLLCIPADTRSGDTPAGVYQDSDGVLRATPRDADRRSARRLGREQGHRCRECQSQV